MYGDIRINGSSLNVTALLPLLLRVTGTHSNYFPTFFNFSTIICELRHRKTISLDFSNFLVVFVPDSLLLTLPWKSFNQLNIIHSFWRYSLPTALWRMGESRLYLPFRERMRKKIYKDTTETYIANPPKRRRRRHTTD